MLVAPTVSDRKGQNNRRVRALCTLGILACAIVAVVSRDHRATQSSILASSDVGDIDRRLNAEERGEERKMHDLLRQERGEGERALEQEAMKKQKLASAKAENALGRYDNIMQFGEPTRCVISCFLFFTRRGACVCTWYAQQKQEVLCDAVRNAKLSVHVCAHCIKVVSVKLTKNPRAHTYTSTLIHVHAYNHTCMYIYKRMCIYTDTHTHTHPRVCMHTYVRTYIHTYMHTFINTHVYVYTFCAHLYPLAKLLRSCMYP
jgi:hypothetical protein